MKVRRLHRHFMGEVTGLDLSCPLTEASRREVQEALDEHAVLVFREQQALDDDAQIAFSALFGPVQRSITVHRQATNRRLKRAELSDISNVDEAGAVLAQDDVRRIYNKPALLWHTDSSFRDPPGRYTFLAARCLPPEGGNTLFADMRAAYDALDEATVARIQPLRVMHSLDRSRELAGAPALDPEEKRNLPATEQPLVRIHPNSARAALYLASHADHIVGWSKESGRSLLAELTAFATRAEFVHEHRWQDGDLVMWDNRCTMHRATPFRDDLYRRDMRRTTVADA